MTSIQTMCGNWIERFVSENEALEQFLPVMLLAKKQHFFGKKLNQRIFIM